MVTYQYTPNGGISIHDDGANSWAYVGPGAPEWDDLVAQIESGEITVAAAPPDPLIYERRVQEEALGALAHTQTLEDRVAILERMTVGVAT